MEIPRRVTEVNQKLQIIIEIIFDISVHDHLLYSWNMRRELEGIKLWRKTN